MNDLGSLDFLFGPEARFLGFRLGGHRLGQFNKSPARILCLTENDPLSVVSKEHSKWKPIVLGVPSEKDRPTGEFPNLQVRRLISLENIRKVSRGHNSINC